MIYTSHETHMGTKHHRRSMRHVAPIYRNNPIGVYGQEDAATGSFITEHPWLTFFIVLAGISTVGAVLGANRY